MLEIGTLGGYSTIHLARALPEGGRLISLELDERHMRVARENIAEAGLSQKVEGREGASGLDGRCARGPVRLVFIDADKDGYPEYLEWTIRLSRPGSVILWPTTLSAAGMYWIRGTTPLGQLASSTKGWPRPPGSKPRYSPSSERASTGSRSSG